MPKKRLKKQSYEALLSEVKKEMGQPRAAASTRSEKMTLRRRAFPLGGRAFNKSYC
jgi:primosomal protein N''